MTLAVTEQAGSRSAMALAAVCLSALMFGLEISSVPAILPTLEEVLQADFRQLQWIMNAYTIGVTMVLMATGALADRFGRKRVFIASIVAFALSSLACGMTQSVSVLIGARFLQGLSGGAMLVCQIAILSHQFRTARERGMAFGWWGIVSGVGLGFGPIIGGAIVALWSWEWVFLVHVVLGIVTWLLAAGGVGESRDPEAARLDLAGMATLSVAVFCLAFFITQGPELGFASPMALLILGISVASFISFVIAEKRTQRPMFDFSVFRIRPFSGAIIGSAAMNISFWPFMIYLPIWFQAGLGYDSVTAGLGLLAYTLPALVMPPLAERLSLRYQPRLVIPAGLFTIGLGFMLMKFGSGIENASWLTMLPGCILAGIGLGLTNTPVTNTTTGAVSPARSGMASGIDMSARMISLAINIPIMGFILVEGVRASLRANLPVGTEMKALQSLAEKIAAGTVSTLPQEVSERLVHRALADGFGLVMVYAGIGVWLLAALSYLVFGRQRWEGNE
ncbi:MFS transporter [Agrobacterium fabrum]|jgi:EmrB/QacA subfamily drug resistance transporter|uniref:MFS transporter n=1 Tax=Agrobacterium fabrum TaxID=1176649 RepID=UPI0009BB9B76|nr:MFS transporter [Agrobacterium fabrum]WCK78679.1 MFS transporter [Agrobacterium fabrum]WIE29723.1 MFS transporter [Agrobacterium fabrum]WIE45683.1 MFS transporter [Agrobacterium fabrum]CAH0281021.1 Multidrug resistance protein Stp [Agrobacterium fabrum]CAH0290484.1 Multidrug resistance protein Stp [Agrobacterium fabrum]